jgi:hypothetical protein
MDGLLPNLSSLKDIHINPNHRKHYNITHLVTKKNILASKAFVLLKLEELSITTSAAPTSHPNKLQFLTETLNST